MTYIQCHFCKSMVDADIFLLQMCATHLAPDFFLDMVLDRFKIKDWLSLSTDTQHLPTRAYRDQDQKVQIIESCLFFIVSILSTRYGSFCERFFNKFLENCQFISMFIFACWFYNWKRSKLFEQALLLHIMKVSYLWHRGCLSRTTDAWWSLFSSKS